MNTHRHASAYRSEQGFTVIELLIATVIFTLVLALVTTGVIFFSNQYYRTANANTAQNLVRTISDDITQSIQFGTEEPISNIVQGIGFSTVCAGGKKYVFKRGVKYNGTTTAAAPGIVLADWNAADDGGCEAPTTAAQFAPYASNKQLLQKNMRVTQFSVTPGGSTYGLSLRIAYAAEADLLCSPADSNCGPNQGYPPGSEVAIANQGATIQCRPGAGSQFCAVANVDAEVVRRLADAP